MNQETLMLIIILLLCSLVTLICLNKFLIKEIKKNKKEIVKYEGRKKR